ncbi:hypothetical protein BC833DRAFT_582861 [Globomyces pollinis-pini]|nr:hypothetical protein BC833DRAFT_582861 [Globomyces pollinis-pini]
MGYQSVYVLQGQCFHGILCDIDSFSLYDFENCTELIETYSISEILQTYDTSIGIIDGIRLLVEKGTRRFVWTTYIPDQLLLPSKSNFLSVVHITMICIGLVGFTTSCVFFGLRYHHRRLRIDLLLFITQIIYFVLLGTDLVYKFTIVTDGLVLLLMEAILGLLSNTGHLMGTLTTWKVLYETFVKEDHRRLYIPIGYTIIITVHYSLTGSDLGWGFLYFDQEDRIYLILAAWSKLNVYWIILMYVWNLCPIILLFRSLLEKKSDKGLSPSKRLWKYLQKDILFLSAILLYILNGMCFFAMSIIYNYYSKIWGNDRSMWAAFHMTVLLIAYHTLTHGVLLYRLPYVMELKSHIPIIGRKKSLHSKETKVPKVEVLK